MGKCTESSYVATIPLKVEKWQSDLLDKRYRILTEMYNRLLGRTLKCRREIYESEPAVSDIDRYIKNDSWMFINKNNEQSKDEFSRRKQENALIVHNRFPDFEGKTDEASARKLFAEMMNLKLKAFREKVINEEEMKQNPKLKPCYFNEYGITGLASSWCNSKEILGHNMCESGITALMCQHTAKSLWAAWAKTFDWKNSRKNIFIRYKKQDVNPVDIFTYPKHSSDDYFDRFEIDLENRFVRIQYNGERKAELRKKMTLPFRIDENDDYMKTVLKCGVSNIATVSVVRKTLCNGNHYYLQLCIHGTPYDKGVKLGYGKVGIDVGPGTVAVVSDDKAFISSLRDNAKCDYQIKLLQKQISRSDRICNPECFDENGAVKKGRKFKHSKRCARLVSKVAEIRRKQSALRKQIHNTIANSIVTEGNEFIVEKNNYKEWQETGYGKSVGNGGPAAFITALEDKVNRRNGTFVKVDCSIAATQFDHTDGSFTKHDVTEREITLSDGTKHNRDLHAAFNLKHADTRKITAGVTKKKKQNPDKKNASNFDVNSMLGDYAKFSENERKFLLD